MVVNRMSAKKFSVSFDGQLALTVRKAAAKEGLSISTWLAEAAALKARQEHLRGALDVFAAEHGALTDADIDELIRGARSSSRFTKPPRTRRRKNAATRRRSAA